VLNNLGASPMRIHIIETAGSFLNPIILTGLLLYTPLLTRMISNVAAMGLSEEKLYNAVNRYSRVGDRSDNIRRVPSYHIAKHHLATAIKHTQPFQFFAETLGVVIDHFPIRVLGKMPSWTTDLTSEPVSKSHRHRRL
jgi:hypothetical protein